jgi:hypothetical protein
VVFDEDGYASDSSASNEDGASSVEAFDATEADHNSTTDLTKDTIASSSSDMSPQKRNSAPVGKRKASGTSMQSSLDMTNGRTEDLARNSDESEYEGDNTSSGEGRDKSTADHDGLNKSRRREKRKNSSIDAATNAATASSMEDYWPFLTNLLDPLMHWVEGPAVEKLSLSGRNSGGQQNNNKDPGLLNVPLQFIALLTYPEIEPNTSKVSLNGM